VPVRDPGTGDFVVVRIGREGELKWGGFRAGSYDMVGKLFVDNLSLYKDRFTAIVVPDHMTPWQYVYWALEAARDSGIEKIGLGANPGTDEDGTLLAMLEVHLTKDDIVLAEDMVGLEVVLTETEDDRVAYTVFDQPAESLSDLYPLVSGFNAEYAEEFGEDYSREVSMTPWVLKAPPLMASGRVLVTLDALRQAAIYTVRFGGEFPPRPGKKR
jgi:hypothetical protein